jgi:hypothetical protein
MSEVQPGREPAAGLRRWLGRRTLRGRLIAGLLVLLAVACAAVGLTTYLALHRALMGQLDRQLRDATMRYGQCLEARPPDTENAPDAEGKPGRDSDHDNDNAPGGPSMCGKYQGPQTFSASIWNSTVVDPMIADGDCHLSQADKIALTGLRTPPGAGARRHRPRAAPGRGRVGADERAGR